MRLITMLRWLILAVLLLAAGSSRANQVVVLAGGCGTGSPVTGQEIVYVNSVGDACDAASVSASVTGFQPATVGTPISVTTGGDTGTLPVGAVVVATNVGANGAYCALGGSSTVAQQYIAPAGGWFAFTVGVATQLTCITSSSTTTVNMVGGSGLATGVGGAGSSAAGGTSAADEAVFTAGTTSYTPTGGLYQTSATSNPLTNGQAGAFQVTANRALFINLRTSAGAETGVAASPIQVSVANTGANATAMLVTGTGGTFPVTGTVAATQSGTWTVQPGNTANSTPWLFTGSGSAGTAATGVLTVQGIASMTPLLVTPAANSAVNVAQVNGVTTLANAGAVGTGSIRVAVGQDVTTVAGSAPGTAGSASANVVTVQGVTSMTPVQVSQATASSLNAQVVGAAASGATASGNPVLQGGRAATASPTAVTDGQAVAAQLTEGGRTVTAPYSIKENAVSGCASTTGTSATEVIAAQGANIKIYVTSISVANTGATTSLMTLQTDTGGSPATIWQTINPTAGGSNIQMGVPLVSVANKNVGFTAGSSSTTQYVCMAGYKGP